MVIIFKVWQEAGWFKKDDGERQMKRGGRQSENSLSLGLILRALNSRNYRLFFTGQSVSLIGTWMQNIAMSWLVYRLSHSPFLLGVVSFAGDIPMFILMPFAGVAADRFNRRRIIIATQSLMMLQAFLLSGLVLSHLIKIWHLVALSVFLGILNSFDMPSRQAFVIEMIEKKEDLPNAIALNSSIFNLARLLGPSIAGILIAAIGEGLCFLINGLSFAAIIAALLAMRITEKPIPDQLANHLAALKQGVSYAYSFLPIRYILSLLAVVSMMGASYTVLMPIFAKDILKGHSYTLGFLMAAGGAGALAAAIYLASRKTIIGLGRMIPMATGLFAAGLMVLALSRHFALSIAVMPLIGFGLMTQMASCNTLIQTIVEDDKRGRVMGIYAMAFRGVAPIGSLIAGALAAKIGAANAVLIGAGVCIAAAFLFARKLPALRKIIRPIYVKQGIIPEVAAGIRSASEASLPPKDQVS